MNLRPPPYQWSWAWRPTPAHENGSAVGPLGRPLLRGGGERRVGHISDLRVCSGHRSFSTQLNAGNRCAAGCSRRSRSTVGARVMRSIHALVCVLLRLLEVIHELAIVAWRHLTFGAAPPLTCSLVFLAPGGCSSCDVRRAALCYGVRMSARRRRPRNARALTVPSGISKYVAICDWV
jgi:hypothetical protein